MQSSYAKQPLIVRGVLLLFITLGIFFFFRSQKKAVVSPIPEESAPTILGIFSPRKDPTVLRKRIQDAAGTIWNNYSVYVVDFNSDFTMGINETEIFTAASVNKIPILATLYFQAKNGKVNLDEVVTLQPADIQDYGTGSMRYDPPGTTYSVKTLANLMMQKSDNTAAYILGNYELGLDSVQAVVNELGMIQTDMVNNKTSNKDMAILMSKIYRNVITNPSTTSEMLGFMKGTDFEDRIPALLPKTVNVYHKVGTTEGSIHDVGIIVDGKLRYYLGIFSSDVQDIDGAPALAAKISKIVYDFMR